MINPKVLEAVHEQLSPIIFELSKYCLSEKIIKMEFETGSIIIKLK